MAKIGISEFTFGFAFLHEQVLQHHGQLNAAPILPSLQAEHDAGWDARLPLFGTDFYFQFKLSEYLSRSNAKYFVSGDYSAPYFRVSLHPNDVNRQHFNLRRLAAQNTNTFYVAPEFTSVAAFNRAFLAQAITTNSRLIPVSACSDIFDSEQHYLSFQSSSPNFKQHSNSENHEGSYSGKLLPDVYDRSRLKWEKIDQRFAASLWRRVSQAIRPSESRTTVENDRGIAPLLDFDPTRASTTEIISQSGKVLQAAMGATLVLVGSPIKG